MADLCIGGQVPRHPTSPLVCVVVLSIRVHICQSRTGDNRLQQKTTEDNRRQQTTTNENRR
eukprot:431264-Karenia_brevis.AAC.1